MELEVQVGTVPWGPGIWILGRGGQDPQCSLEGAALDTLSNSPMPQPPMAQEA